MSYASRTIGSVIDDVNQRYFLPAIQRPYVWSSSQVVALFDSLLKGYPISSFMFWAVNEETKHEVRSYKFIENYRSDVHNEPASVEGRNVTLVLDGQQRMTSLLIGLRGTFAEKKARLRKANPDAWSARTLYLDLLKDPDNIEDDDELGVTYGLKFHEIAPRNSHRQYWFKLGSILNYQDDAQLDILMEKLRRELHHGVTPYEANLAERNLRRLRQVVWRDEAVNFYTEQDQSVDRVLDIFVRANDGGVKLSKADLLMSMITSKWSSGKAREDIFGFVDYINRDLGAPNKITKDWVLKAALVLCEYDVVYNVANFTRNAIETIEGNWIRIKVAIETTFRMLNRMGLTGENLGSLNAVLPLVYYVYNQPDYSFRGSSAFERRNAEAMHRWLLNSLFVGAFVGASDGTIAVARGVIRDHLRLNRDFPIEELFDALARGGRLSRLDERAIEELLALDYSNRRSFVALSLLYRDLDWIGTVHHIDHIIPQADATRSVLRSQNLSEHQIEDIIAASRSIGNLQLLPAGENLEKNALPFRSWITGRDRHYREQHMIPDAADLWDVRMLPEFVRQRERLIRQRLMSSMGVDA